MHEAMGVIFSNIYDDSFGDLTKHRTVASLPFGSRYRQIDFVLSNMSNSGIKNIGLITKYNYRSLMDHLGTCDEWDLNRKNAGLTLLPPFVSGNTGVYKGKLEALYSAVNYLETANFETVVLSDTTVLCNLDYQPIIEEHLQSGADVTALATLETLPGKRHEALVLRADRDLFAKEVLVDKAPLPGEYLGMGMFVIGRKLLLEIIRDAHSKGQAHLEREFLQTRFNRGELKIGIAPVGGVVLRNRDLPSFFQNNMALLKKEVRDGLFFADRPVYTKVRDETPTYYGEESNVKECLVADGCEIRGTAEKSVLFRGVKIEQGAKVKNSIIMQGSHIGAGAELECVILDKDVAVSPGARLVGTPEHTVIVNKGETV